MSQPQTVTIGNRTFTILFPDLLRPLTKSERQSLSNDIRKHGVLVPIVVDEDDGIIDGGNRAQIAAEVGLKNVRTDLRKGLSLEEKVEQALSLNTLRRQFSGAECKAIKKNQRALIAEALKAAPEKSNRSIAEDVGASDKTVGSLRTELEERAEIPHVETRTDTKGREQPATKSQPEREPGCDDDLFDKRDEEKDRKRRESRKPKPVVKDAVGNVIPDNLRDIFGDPMLSESIAELAEAQKNTERIVNRLKSKAKYLPFVLVKTAFDHLHDAAYAIQCSREDLEAGVPYAVCAKCNGKGEGCKECRFGGYVPKWRYEELQQQGALS